MAKRIERFEDFIAWQKARKLTADIYRVTSEGRFARDFGLKDQIRRAAVSSMSNLARTRKSQPSFISFFRLQKHLAPSFALNCMSALDVGYISLSTFDRLMAQATEVGQILGGLRQAVERRRESLRR